MTAYHGAMMYNTLLGIDGNFNPQPQMVGKTNISADRKTYTFELRPGLRWYDGTAVTARDCVASLRRWQVKNGAGIHLFARVADTPVVDEKTFRIVLKEPYGLLIEALAKTSTSMCFMMKAEIAATDPNTQITRHIGSGPFKFVEAEYRQGSRVVYERNPDYVPRSEAASGIAGGKRVLLDRVIWNIMPDAQTASSALQDEFGLAYLFISHDLAVVEHIGHRIAVMYLGRIVELAPKDRIFAQPQHPYTEALMAAAPIANPKLRRKRLVIEGDVPSPMNPPSGCHFHTRCPYAEARCKQTYPPLQEIAPGHFVACHLRSKDTAAAA